jgi:tRNA (mo5U34)-methyltransferase
MAFDHVRVWKQEFESAGWWHSFELPDGSVIEGKCNLGGLKERLARFPIPEDLTGKRVLDIGTWDGWFAFELAKRGAHVVAIDTLDNPRFYEMRRLLGLESRVEYRQLDVYDVTPESVGRFDIVMFLGVLYHLKHPLLALERVCSVTLDLACVDSFVLDHEERTVMEFFESEEFGGQTDNWVAPSVSCLAAFCRTAGFARAELRGRLPYSAPFACYRHWAPLKKEWGTVPRILRAFHHLDFSVSFSTHRDDYVTLWFEHESGKLLLDDVQPEVSGFGTRPVHVSQQHGSWQTTFKLPPGLEPGWHDVRMRIKGSPISEPCRIAVDIVTGTEQLLIVSAKDGTTFEPDAFDRTQGNEVALWLTGIPESADLDILHAKVNGLLAPIRYLQPPAEIRQLNVEIPRHLTGELEIRISMAHANAVRKVRCR